ncbi:MAG: GIY-YIG nuclease family protein [Xanthobacteraceae bacterium]
MEWNERWHARHPEPIKPEPIKSIVGDRVIFDSDTRGYIYFLQQGDRVKIGFSKNPFTRPASLRTGMASQPTTMLAVAGRKRDETRIHARLNAYRVSAEWFVASKVVNRLIPRSLVFQGERFLDLLGVNCG